MNLLCIGILMAALPEELWRVLAQTRLGAILRNDACGWFLPALIWSAFHWPTTIWSFLTPIPIGLLWGYSIHRTKSILPAVLAHGTNLWGLQAI